MKKKMILPAIITIVILIAAILVFVWFDGRSFSCTDNIHFSKGFYVCGYLIDNSEILPESIPVKDMNYHPTESFNQFHVTGKIITYYTPPCPPMGANPDEYTMPQAACGQELKSLRIASIDEVIAK